MTDLDRAFGDDADAVSGPADSAGLDVRLAHELIERARAEGVSLVGPDGLLAGITKTVLQAALDAEMTAHLGYERGDARTERSSAKTRAQRVLREVAKAQFRGDRPLAQLGRLRSGGFELGTQIRQP
jgi:hypothetical protein